MSVRTPPRPPYERKKGRCAMCGEPPAPPARTWCSKVCVDWWWLATDRFAQLKHLLELHGAFCWECGITTDYVERFRKITFLGEALEVEHVRPLWSLTPEERGELKWWLPYNLQLLCRPCHKAKSKREAADRAAARRPTPPDPPAPLF